MANARPARPGCNTTTDDPYLRVALEKDMVYRILVRDQNSLSRAEPGNMYRLAVRRLRPDFHLLAAPSSPWNTGPEIPLRWPFVVRAGGAFVVPVVAIRQDRFAGDIVVSAEGLPAGLSCEPVTIRDDKSEANLVVLADAGAKPWVGEIHVSGASKIGETQLRRAAVPTSLVTDTATAKFERSRLNHRLVLAVAPEAAPVSLRWSKPSLEVAAGRRGEGQVGNRNSRGIERLAGCCAHWAPGWRDGEIRGERQQAIGGTRVNGWRQGGGRHVRFSVGRQAEGVVSQ